MNALRQKFTFFLAALLILAGPIFYLNNFATAANVFCERSEACKAAEQQEQEANDKANAATATANDYQAKVDELNGQISVLENEIAAIQQQIDVLTVEIAEKETKLHEQQAALVNLLVQLHFDDKTDTITLLAGASSLSDYAEKQARTDVIKSKISQSANSIQAARDELEAKKSEQQTKKEDQKSAQAQLAEQKKEQEAIVSKYQADAASFAADAAAAREAKNAAIQEEIRKNANLYGGSVYFGDNTYPWQDRCPDQQDMFYGRINGQTVGGLGCECVSYAGWKAYESFGVILAYGNAYDWAWRARQAGYEVNNTPAAYSIGQTTSGIYGHVFWVESVNSDGSINITEYNNASSTYTISGNWHMGDFGSRTIPASQVNNFNYIHFY